MDTANLPFLGNRNYLQSATLFDYLLNAYTIEGKISFKISNLIFSPNIIVDTEYKETPNASIAFGENLEYSLYIYEGKNNNSIVRQEYNEEKIVEVALFQSLSASFSVIEGETFIRSVVAVNKALHKQLFKLENGQWLFVRLDLKHVPILNSSYEIKLVNYGKEQLTCGIIYENSHELGTIYFSWKTK